MDDVVVTWDEERRKWYLDCNDDYIQPRYIRSLFLAKRYSNWMAKTILRHRRKGTWEPAWTSLYSLSYSVPDLTYADSIIFLEHTRDLIEKDEHEGVHVAILHYGDARCIVFYFDMYTSFDEEVFVREYTTNYLHDYADYSEESVYQ